jgi:hypothetical protein
MVAISACSPEDVKFVLGGDGRPPGVSPDRAVRRMADLLEDSEDVAAATEALASRDAAGGHPQRAGFIMCRTPPTSTPILLRSSLG